MAIVIHTIKNHQYAYDHHREGGKVIATYLGPVGAGGHRAAGQHKLRSPIHGGGAPKKVTQQEAKPKAEEKKVEVKQEAKQESVEVTQQIEPEPPHKGFLIEGDTYTSRREIKAMGGKWNNDLKGWVVPPTSTNAKKINEMKNQKKVQVSAYKSNEDPYKRLTEAERLDIRAEKMEKKAERYEKKSARLEKSSNEKLDKAHQIASMIPMGQPILVGHHSEKRARRDQDKIHSNMRAGIAEGREAAEAARKAEGAKTYAEVYTKDTTVLKGRIVKAEEDIKMTTIEKFNEIIAENKGIITAGKMMNLIKKLAENKQYNEIPYGIGLMMNFQNGKDVQRAYYNVLDIAITNRDFDVAEKYNNLLADDDLKNEMAEIIAEKKGL